MNDQVAQVISAAVGTTVIQRSMRRRSTLTYNTSCAIAIAKEYGAACIRESVCTYACACAERTHVRKQARSHAQEHARTRAQKHARMQARTRACTHRELEDRYGADGREGLLKIRQHDGGESDGEHEGEHVRVPARGEQNRAA